MGRLKDVETKEEFQSELTGNSGKLVVVDFYAQWCPHCKQIAPTVKKLSEKYDIVIITVDIDEAEEVSSGFLFCLCRFYFRRIVNH